MNLYKTVICFALVLLVSCSRDLKKPGWEYVPNMIHAVPYEAYSENTVTKDGKTMLQPVVGTIARGQIPYPYPNTEEGLKKASENLINPILATTKNLNRGQFLYENYCLVCHGVAGKGDGPLIPKFPNPPSLTSRRLKKLTPGHLYHVITHGVGDMPAHAQQVSREERWHLVHYVQKLQGKKVALSKDVKND